MSYDPKDPEQAFALMDCLRENASNLRKSLLKQADPKNADPKQDKNKNCHTNRFINDVLEEQGRLIEEQDAIHKEINFVEIEWSKANSVESSTEKYQQAEKFFKDKENKIDEMTKKMHVLTEKVAAFPQ